MSLMVKNVTRRFNGNTAVKNISFQTYKGEIVGLLGTSGCGKSTLLRAISGLDEGYEGEVSLNGNAVRNVNTNASFIFQEPRLMPWLTVKDNVSFGLSEKKQEKGLKAERYIELVGLKGYENYYPLELSGGMAQRVAIARALVTSPELLLLDEPFSALDAFTKMQLQDLLLKIWSEYRSTMVLVTHDIDEALYLCDRIIILTGQPGVFKQEFVIEEPKPRRRGSQQVAAYKERILKCLEL
ncbi:ABC transporter ATP-binding protein [Pseudalkalibacillus caeni]|uniref:ABC transporter ATP-binding protein n=1 Tax=Exobacillus caeni TaxID=2574798 RepID=A0A5R9FGX1_9BACL|nr:ABC transporter ATP-binding protein [Pseudalkalibacillus caeni]TLS38795.1 ABC transporter ATP-binding protein [Pseudalkalibacillus caeni]